MTAIDWQSARGVQGLVWIALHRENPRFTVEDAGRIKFSSFDDPDPEPREPDPTPAPAPSRRAKSGAST
jgi:hypothetical protein